MLSLLTSNVLLQINVGDVLGRALQNKTPQYDVPKALDELWYVAMQGGLYKMVTFLGMFVAVMAVGFWCFKLYIAFQEGSLNAVAMQMIWPIIIVLMLSNDARNLRDLTMGTRDLMNAMNRSVNEVVGAEVNIRKALTAISGSYELQMAMGTYLNVCNQITDYPNYLECINKVNLALDEKQENYKQALAMPSSGMLQSKLDRWTTYTNTLKTNVLKPRTPQEVQQHVTLAAGNMGITGNTAASGTTTPTTPSSGGTALPKGFDPLKASTYESETNIKAVIEVLTSARSAFLYVIETMHLVTGLMGPVFLGLSLFPVGTKPLVTWGVSFLTIGFCKICYNLISGLAAVAMVYAGPGNADMTVAAVVLGLLSPVLSFYLASNSGFSALSTITHTAQGFGLNSGISSYTTYSGEGGGGGNYNPRSSSSGTARRGNNAEW